MRINYWGHIAFVFICSFVWTELLLYTQNNLLLNDNWIDANQSEVAYLQKRKDFFYSRLSLSGNKLNLGLSDYATEEIHQIVVTKKQYDPDSIEFYVEFFRDSYIDVILNWNKDKFSAIRISNEKDRPSIYYESLASGKFIKKIELSSNGSIGDVSHVQLLQTDNGIDVKINSRRIFEIESVSLNKAQYGIRGGLADIRVDDILFKKNNEIIFDESFSNRKEYLRIYFFNTIIFGVIYLAFVIFRLSKKGYSCILALGSLFFIYDYFYYSRIPYDYIAAQKEGVNFVDQCREKKIFVFQEWYNLVSGTNNYFRPEKKMPKVFSYCHKKVLGKCNFIDETEWYKFVPNGSPLRVAIYGGSATYGLGASRIDEIYFAKSLRQLWGKYDVEGYNFSKIRIDSNDLLKLFQVKSKEIKPSISMVSHMDVNNLTTAELLKIYNELVNTSYAVGGKLVLMVPLVNDEYQPAPHHRKHTELDYRLLVNKHPDVCIWNPRKYMNSKDVLNSGNVWTDKTHLTPWGHELWGKWLAAKMENTIVNSHCSNDID